MSGAVRFMPFAGRSHKAVLEKRISRCAKIQNEKDEVENNGSVVYEGYL